MYGTSVRDLRIEMYGGGYMWVWMSTVGFSGMVDMFAVIPCS